MSQRRKMQRALRIVARTGDTADVFVEGVIGEELRSAEFREQLARAKGAKVLRVFFNSDGGVVTEGTAMYNALRAFPGRKIGIVTGIAASIASVILMACDEIKVAKGAYIMIHNPAGGARPGTGSTEMRKLADDIDMMRGELLDIYEARTGIERSKLEGMLDAETYFTAEEAVDAGIADAIENFEAKIDSRIVARLDPEKIPAALRAAAKGKVRSMKNKDKKAALEEEMAKLKAKLAELEDSDGEEEEVEDTEEEVEDTEEEPHDEESEDDDKPKDAATTALVALVKQITGAKSTEAATGKLAALIAKGGASAASSRAQLVTAAIKAGKLPPAMKDWALSASEKAFGAFITSMGGEKSFRLGKKHTEPKDPPSDAPTGDLSAAESKVASLMRVAPADMIKSRTELPEVSRRAGGEK